MNTMSELSRTLAMPGIKTIIKSAAVMQKPKKLNH